MHLVCLDLEGVLVPEIWISVAEKTGIEALRLTTRDVSDYDELMKHRISVLDKNGLRLPDIQNVIDTMEPLHGAEEFLSALRERTQVVILSDTFTQFAGPLMRKLARPTLFCNSLVVEPDGRISDYRLRTPDGKAKAVRAFGSIGFSVIAAGDSYNDISMLKVAHAGILFRPPENVVREFPDFPVATNHAELLERIAAVLGE